MEKNIIFHGSHIQNLTEINARNGRFGEKIFGTFTFNKALAYCLHRKAGGSGIIGISTRSYVLDFNMQEALKENFGSIYVLDASGFKFDNHKGEQETWVFSIEKPVKVVYEIKLENVLSYWDVNHIVGVSSEDSIKLHQDFLSNMIDYEYVNYVKDKFRKQVESI